MKLIDKDKVAAEIEKKLQDLIVSKKDAVLGEERVISLAKIDMCKEILSFLNTIETKDPNSNNAFINKAVNFLNYKLDDVVAIRVPGTIMPQHVVKQDVIEDFVKTMKGE